MRYHYTNDTLYIRGAFRAASTGIDGGIRNVATILNSTVPKDFDHEDPLSYIRNLLSAKTYGTDAFGLLTAVSMKHLCILKYDFITVFVTAGVSNPNPDPEPGKPHTINIIITSDEGFTDSALLETIMVAAEAKAHALRRMGRDFTGTTSDAIVAAAAGDLRHTYAGTCTQAGRRVYDAVLHGVMHALDRHEGRVLLNRPSYFIYSRYGGEHWVEWKREGCPYYPCHFAGQACDFCYCPFYPCHDAELGSCVDSSAGGKVWSCSDCLLLHRPDVAVYLKSHPDAGLAELKTYAGPEPESREAFITGRTQ
jgi:adenosylcobinamide hydrolase